MSTGLFRQIKRNSLFCPDFSHLPELPSRSPLHLVSARRPGHAVLGRMVRDPCDKQQHHHWAPDIILKHYGKALCLLLPQDWNQVAAGALFACTVRVCPSFVLQLLFTAELQQNQPFGRVFCLHLPFSSTMDAIPITGALAEKNWDN